MLSELLCSNGDIIRVGGDVIVHAATSTALEEAAVAELKPKMHDAAIPSAVRSK